MTEKEAKIREFYLNLLFSIEHEDLINRIKKQIYKECDKYRKEKK